MWGDAWAQTYATYAGSVVRVNCLPEISRIEILFNRLCYTFDYDGWEEPEMEAMAKKGYLLFDNQDYEDKKREVSCEFGKDKYEVKFKSQYGFMVNNIKFDILKNGDIVVADGLINQNFRNDDWTVDDVIVDWLSYNIKDGSIEYVVVRDIPYDDSIKRVDKLYYKKLDKIGASEYEENMRYPERLEKQVVDYENLHKAVKVECDETLNIVELRMITFDDENMSEDVKKDKTKLLSRGLYILGENEKPYIKKCKYKGSSYEVEVSPQSDVLIKKDGKEIVENIKLNDDNRNEIITYLRYNYKFDYLNDENRGVMLIYWDKNKEEYGFCDLENHYYNKKKYTGEIHGEKDIYDCIGNKTHWFGF